MIIINFKKKNYNAHSMKFIFTLTQKITLKKINKK